MYAASCIHCAQPLPHVFGQPAKQCPRCHALQPAHPQPPQAHAPAQHSPTPPGGGAARAPKRPGRGAGIFFAFMTIFAGVLSLVAVRSYVVAGLRAVGVDVSSLSEDSSASGGSSAYFENPSEVEKALHERFGKNVQFLEVAIYADRATIRVRNPKKPKEVDDYLLQRGRFDEGRPVKLIGPGKADLDPVCLRTKDLDFAVVAKLVRDANKRLSWEGAEVSHVIGGRPLPFGKDPVWRVYVNSPRHSGSVEYDAKGKLIKIRD